MKKLILLIITLHALLGASTVLAGSGECIRIVVTSQSFDHDKPWQKKGIGKSVAFGSVLPGKKILTTAYAISNHVMIELTRPGESKKFAARVLVKDYHSGLALITAVDPSFFEGIEPVSLAARGNITGRQAIIRKWDDMGAIKEYRAMAVKSSIRIYEPNCPVLMHIMTTTMKNGGNGEGVFIDGKFAGISTGLDSGSKTLYVIANETIQRLLKDAEDGSYQGIPYFWLDYVSVNGNINLRNQLGMKEKETGVYICEISETSSGSSILKNGDVILEVGGTPVSDDGMYLDKHYGRLNFYGLINMTAFVGDTVTMKILRNKKRETVSFKLKKMEYNNFLIPMITNDHQARYTVFGGLIFQEMTLGFLQTWGQDWMKKGNDRFIFYYGSQKYAAGNKGKRYVILNRILPAPCNKGYEYKKNLMLKSINGKEVNNLPHLKKLLSESKGQYVVFNFKGGSSIVLDSMEVAKFQQRILRVYNISNDTYLGKGTP